MSRGKRVKKCRVDPCGDDHGSVMMVGCERKKEGKQHDRTVWEKLREADIVGVKGVTDRDAGLLVVVFFFCICVCLG